MSDLRTPPRGTMASGPAGRGVAPAGPPPSPPLLNRVIGGLLLLATLGVASCQAFVAAVS